jgi:hypothetical protein
MPTFLTRLCWSFRFNYTLPWTAALRALGFRAWWVFALVFGVILSFGLAGWWAFTHTFLAMDKASWMTPGGWMTIMGLLFPLICVLIALVLPSTARERNRAEFEQELEDARGVMFLAREEQAILQSSLREAPRAPVRRRL